MLRITTSDALSLAANENNIFISLTGKDFIGNRFMKALLFILPSVCSGLVVALFAVFKLNVMTLLTKQEQG